MPTYKVTDPTTGKVLKLTGDSPPTEAELNEVFANAGGMAAPKPAPAPQYDPSTGLEVAPEKMGIMGRIGEAATKRINAIANPAKISRVDKLIPSIGGYTNTIGELGGLAGDVIGEGIKATPFLGEAVDLVGQSLAGNPVVQRAAKLASNIPEDIRTDLGRLANATMLYPGALAGRGALKAGAEGVNIGRDVAGIITRKTPEMIDRELTSVISRGVEKAIRPTVVGKRTAPQVRAYYEKAKNAVKTIIDNKDSLVLTDAEGGAVKGLPKTVKQFSEAIDQTKRAVFKQYDDMATKAGQAGVEVDLYPAVKELESIASNKVLNDLSPEIADYAMKRSEALSGRATYTTTEAQDAIAHLNKSLESFYRNPSYETANRAGVDSLIVNNIRKSLDDAIENSVGAGYQDLKNTYGALKAIEKEVAQRAVVNARKNTKGLLDFTDVLTSGELISGILTMNPAMIAKGAAGRGIKEYFKILNNPDRIVKGMFSDAESLLNRRNAPPVMRTTAGQALGRLIGP
jgi:hypothetical protein